MAGSGMGEETGTPGRKIVTVALMLAMAVVSLEQTVVSTAMPSIIAQLRGLDIYPWVFSAYLLAATVTTPLYGKLADLLGRKRVLLFGLAVFLAGSILSGLATSMPGLIAMRVVQGAGAGAVAPIVLTLLGDLFSLKERARVQGLFSAVWGVSSLAGPALGGVLTDNLSWRWVFFVTAPFGAVSAWILARHVHEAAKPRAEKARIDWEGALLFACGSTALLTAVLQGSRQEPIVVVGLLALAAAFLGLFVWQERKAADPVLPMDLLLRPTIATAVVGSFVIGVLLFGIDTYVPLFVQGVLGGTATRAGRAITPLFLSWSISVAVAAKVVARWGFRKTALVGSVLIASGALALAAGAQWPGSAGPWFLGGMVVIGLGMGPTSLSYILAVQHAVEWGQRGVATGAVIFFRTIGGALGVGLLGALLGYQLTGRILASGARGIDVAAALRPETHDQLSPDHLRLVQEALGRSLRDAFLLMFVMASLTIVCSAALPRRRSSKEAAAPEVGPAAPEDDLALAATEL
jgi:EmrB/QacA subfamily drug resistance transporter